MKVAKIFIEAKNALNFSDKRRNEKAEKSFKLF